MKTDQKFSAKHGQVKTARLSAYAAFVDLERACRDSPALKKAFASDLKRLEAIYLNLTTLDKEMSEQSAVSA